MSAAVASCTHVFPSDLGWLALEYGNDRLSRISFGHPSAAAAAAALGAASAASHSGSTTPPEWIVKLASRLQAYCAGQSESFADVPLDLTHLSEFQQRVVRACRKIGRGKVRTYGELAAIAGSPGAARAVGNVMATNRYPIIVPCHRVVGSAGSLGGFSAVDGINTKRRMLEMEGARLATKKKRALSA